MFPRLASACLPITVVIALGANSARAADTSVTTKVTADVFPACTVEVRRNLDFGTAPVSANSFGGLSVSSTVTGQGWLYVMCSFSWSYKLYAPYGSNAFITQRRLKSPSGDYYLFYDISAASSGGEAVPGSPGDATSSTYSRTGTGSQELITIYGRIPSQTVSNWATSPYDTQVTAYGSYVDDIVFTVSF